MYLHAFSTTFTIIKYIPLQQGLRLAGYHF